MGADPGRQSGPSPAAPDAADVLSLVLPSVIDGLGAEARRTRVSAAWTACRLADERPDLGAELAERLVRAVDRAPREPLVRTLSSLHERHPERVGEALRSFDAGVVAAVREAQSWDFDAALRADGSGTVAVGSRVVDAPDDAVTVHQRPMPDPKTSPDTAGSGPEADDRGTRGSSQTADTATREPASDEQGAAVRSGDSESGGAESAAATATSAEADVRSEPASEPDSMAERRRRIQAAENSEAFAAVQLVSTFDEVTVVDPPRRGRYGHVLPSRARIDEAEYGVDLLFFDEPEGDAREFASAVHRRLQSWASVDETTGIVAVADHGDHPRPWVATPRAESTLADREPPAPGVALRDARELATGLAAVHERGLVHGGIDPHDVSYPAVGFESEPSPSLSHLGVMTVFRGHFGPAEYVDPRYAAPEYFDDSYGSIDHATDVYHLGAVLYRLFVGRPPYTGDYDAVRTAILDDDVPRPSDVRPEIPDSVDEVLTTALAPRKLRRFEGATDLRRALEQLG